MNLKIKEQIISMTQTKGLKRNSIDKYYTKNNVVDLCLELVKKYIEINANDLIIEPSAGNGSFIDGIRELTNNYIFYDLEPDNNEIIIQDYLLYDYTIVKNDYNKIHIIGNPPFGRQSSLAIKFIKKSSEYCDSISFILPKSFKKDSMKKHFPLHFHLIAEHDLPVNSFLIDNKEYDVQCVFQIWQKKDFTRHIEEKKIENKFRFIKKEIITLDNDSDIKKLFNNDKKINTNNNYDFDTWKSKFISIKNIKRSTALKKLKELYNKDPLQTEIEAFMAKEQKLIYSRFNDINNSPDISFRRVGIYAGTIDREINNKSHESHYFIKFNNPLTEKKYIELSNINYPSKNNTVGPRSISKQELIKEFNTIL